MGVTKARLVEVGALVVTAGWRVTPDKYEGPREFDDYVKALRYSEEVSGRYELLVGLLNQNHTRFDLECTPLDSGGELPRGSVVVDRGFRIDNWRFGESFKTPDEAYLSVPDGKYAVLFEELWLGPPGSLGFRVAGPQFDFVGGGEPTWSDVPGPAGTDVLEGEK
jgi:hypothetical protein